MKLSRLLNINAHSLEKDAAVVVTFPLGSKTGPAPDPEIGSIHYCAQEVQPSGLFVAVPGLVADGHSYIDEAVNRGAAAVVVQRPVQKDIIMNPAIPSG